MNRIPKIGGGLELDTIRYKVVSKEYSRVRAIFSELGQSDTILLRALKEGHGIEFNSLTEDPVLHFVVSDQQLDLMKEAEISNPTWLQLLGTCEVIDTDVNRAKSRFEAIKKGNATEE